MLLAHRSVITKLSFFDAYRARALGSTSGMLYGLTAMTSIVLQPYSSMLSSASALGACHHALPFTGTNLLLALGMVGSIVVAALSCFF